MNNKKVTIGIDIGGTNTDAVLLSREKLILGHVKVPTTSALDEGFFKALAKLLAETSTHPENVEGIYVGTTHAINAILQGSQLHKVGVIRLAGHHPITLPPAYGWDSRLRNTILAGSETVDGGFECNGRIISPFNSQSFKAAVQKLLDSGMESLAICGVFSPFHADQEYEAASLVHEVPVTLSHQMGGLGFIERENAAILNESLKKVMTQGFSELLQSCRKLGLKCPLQVTQNNGSLISLEHAIEFPVLTISAGPTNSFIGAARLAGLIDAIVVDIGGTSTDVGIIENGFPRRSLNNSEIGGISLNFSMPDVLSIALGGGSHIKVEENRVHIGPDSCARKLFDQSTAFGGPQLTMTDAALVLDRFEIPGADKAKVSLMVSEAKGIMKEAFERIDRLVNKIAGLNRDLPVVLVGGGAQLIPPSLLPDRYRIPFYSSVANAYGAALAEISFTVDKTISLERRDIELQSLKEEALLGVISRGGKGESARVVDLQIFPYHYMPGNAARVLVTAAAQRG